MLREFPNRLQKNEKRSFSRNREVNEQKIVLVFPSPKRESCFFLQKKKPPRTNSVFENELSKHCVYCTHTHTLDKITCVFFCVCVIMCRLIDWPAVHLVVRRQIFLLLLFFLLGNHAARRIIGSSHRRACVCVCVRCARARCTTAGRGVFVSAAVVGTVGIGSTLRFNRLV